jgi:pimeloyl-ACP methyl ester carboxylesterase
MKNIIASMVLAVSAAFTDAKLITIPPVTTTGTDIAIIWIHGMSCDNAAYQTLAAEVQAQGVAKGQRIWIGLPDFIFDAPEPILIDHYVSDSIAELRKEGFTGDKLVMAGHSLGGVMAQKYTAGKNSGIKA